MSQERWIAGPPASRAIKSVEWYTPGGYIEAARSVMGGIDLDPASSKLANTVVKATYYYDVQANGLEKAWAGRVWLNPPYGRGDKNVSFQEIWSCRLIAQYEAGITHEAILLVNSAHDTRWFQRLWAYPVCLVSHRISFYSPTGTALRAVSGASHGSAFAYFGPNVARFCEIFKQFGRVVPPVVPVERAIPKHLLYTKGWPTVMPTRQEALLLSEIRRDIAEVMQFTLQYSDPNAIFERYAALMAKNAQRGQAVPLTAIQQNLWDLEVAA